MSNTFDELGGLKNLLLTVKIKEELEKEQNLKSVSNPKNNKTKLTGEQKFLLLHYLKLGNEIKVNTKRALLYDVFIDELGTDTIRTMFSDIRRYETERNLNALLDFFRHLKLNSKARDIENKLKKFIRK